MRRNARYWCRGCSVREKKPAMGLLVATDSCAGRTAEPARSEKLTTHKNRILQSQRTYRKKRAHALDQFFQGIQRVRLSGLAEEAPAPFRTIVTISTISTTPNSIHMTHEGTIHRCPCRERSQTTYTGSAEYVQTTRASVRLGKQERREVEEVPRVNDRRGGERDRHRPCPRGGIVCRPGRAHPHRDAQAGEHRDDRGGLRG